MCMQRVHACWPGFGLGLGLGLLGLEHLPLEATPGVAQLEEGDLVGVRVRVSGQWEGLGLGLGLG